MMITVTVVGDVFLLHVTLHRVDEYTYISLYTVFQFPKKPSPLMFDNNFGKCGPIFKILSPDDS